MQKKFKKLIVPIILIIVLIAGYFMFFDKDLALTARAGYLQMTETADYFHVQSSVYGIRLWKSNADYYLRYYDGDGTYVAHTIQGPEIRTVGGGRYRADYDSAAREATLVENNKTRIVIKLSGKYNSAYNSSGTNASDGSDDFTYDTFYYIYPEYFTYKIVTNTYDGVNLYDGSYQGSTLFKVGQREHYFDSGETYHGTTTGESLASNYNAFTNIDYAVVLATSTPDWQVVKISDTHSGTTTLKTGFATEVDGQGFYCFYDGGNLKGISETVFAVRPKINTIASGRLAWAQQMLAMDTSVFSVGSAVNDLNDEVYDAYTPDGTMHVTADNNKAEFTMHANATNTWAVLSATSTAGAQSLSIASDQGLEDSDGVSDDWAYLGNRKPYGSFDVADPDVLFYWDMNSTTTRQAPNKGVGTVYVNGQFEVNEGVAGDSIGPPATWDSVSIDYKNINPARGSFAFWYRNASTTDTYSHLPVYHGNSWTESDELRITYDPLLNWLDVHFNGVTTINNYNPLTYIDIEDGEWHFWRVNYDANEDLTELYIDGKLLQTSSTSFEPLELYRKVYFFRPGGTVQYFMLDEFYISSDPNQPDTPSHYDVIRYTDISAGSITGIPETGIGAITWNHPIDSPIWQTQREDPVFTVHDWSPKTRATSTGEAMDHLVLDLPLDGTGINENVGKVYDEVSGTWIGTTSSRVSFEQGLQGNAATFPLGSIGTVNETIILGEGETFINSKGTIEFDYKYNGNGSYYGRFFSAGTNYFELRRGNSNLSFSINYIDANFTSSVDIDDYAWHHFRVSWDDDSNLRQVYIDDTLELSTSTAYAIPSAAHLNEFGIACEYTGTYFNNGDFDNFKIYNDVILPYGAFYTGEPNDGHYGGAHPDITYYDDMTSVTNGYSPKIGSGTVSVSNSPTLVSGIDGTANSAVDFDAGTEYFQIDNDDIDVNQGRVGFWYKPTATSSDGDTFLSFENSGSTVINFYRSLINGGLRMTYNAQSFNSDALTWSTSTWYWIEYVWDQTSDVQKIYRNGEEVMSATTDITAPTFDSVFVGKNQWGDAIDGAIDEFYITNSPDTPMIPTAFGKPLIAPQVAIVDGGATLKQIETNYDIANLTDIGTYLVTYHGTLTSDTTFLITETLNKTQSTDSSVPLDRIHPLISVIYTSGYATITVQRGSGEYSDDYKLIFSETDAGVSSCFLGQGTAGSWGTDLCSATNLLSEVDQNSVIQTDQTGVLNLLQNAGVETIVRNVVVLPSEATTTEEWHIFADGSIVIDRKFEKGNGNTEARAVNSSFANTTYHPATPSTTRGAGIYYDSLFVHLTDVNSGRQDDYLNSVTGATSSVAGFNADSYADMDANGFGESYGAYTVGANYMADPSVPQCAGTCGQPIYHTIGTTTATVNVTTSDVETISSGLYLIKFSGSPDLSGIHKRDRFLDGGDGGPGSEREWNIINVDDTNDQIIVGDQEVNSGTPSALNSSQATVGPWYNSLSSWEVAEDRDLTSIVRYANGEIEMAECWPMRDTSNATISVNGWTTAKNNYIKIYTPTAQRHKGKWSDSYYNLIFSANSDYVRGISINEDFVRIDGLQLELNNNDYNYCSLVYTENINSDSEIYIGSNILQGVLTTSNTDLSYGVSFFDSDGKGYIVNNIIYDFDLYPQAGVYSYGIHVYGENYLYNNTFYNCTIGIRGVNKDILKNNLLAASVYRPYYSTSFPDFGTDYNATDGSQVLEVGNNNRINQTFSFVSTSTKDFHLASGDTGAKGHGANITNSPFEGGALAGWGLSHDIDGQPRSGSWDIGADQVVEKYLNKFKIELDSSAQTMYQPRFLINDFYPQSGKRGSEDTLILFHDTMDSIVDEHEPKVGSSTVSVNGSPSGLADSVRGKGIKILDGENSSLSISTEGNILKNRGSVSFWYTPNTYSSIADSRYFFRIDNGSDDFLFRRPGSAGVVSFEYGGTTVDKSVWEGDNNWTKNEPLHFLVSWHTVDNKAYRYLTIDGKTVDVLVDENLQDNLGSTMYVGNYDSVATYDVDGIIDEFKIYSEAILPFGAFYTGYEQNGNYLNADPNLVFYWDAESETARSGKNLLGQTVTLSSNASLVEEDKVVGNRSYKFSGSYTNTDFVLPDVDYSRGCIGSWIKNTSLGVWSEYLTLHFDSNNALRLLATDSGSYVRADYVGDNDATYYLSGAVTENTWNWVKVCWDNYDETIWTETNGIKGSVASLDAIWNTSVVPIIEIGNGSGYTPSNIYIDQIFVTNDISDEIPTAFGRPLNIPLMKVNNTRQRLGYDYFVSWTPDPSSVILQYFKNTNASTVFEIGASEGMAQVRRLKGGLRLDGGVRF